MCVVFFTENLQRKKGDDRLEQLKKWRAERDKKRKETTNGRSKPDFKVTGTKAENPDRWLFNDTSAKKVGTKKYCLYYCSTLINI